MEDSMPYATAGDSNWKLAVGWVAAIAMGVLFLVSGVWKVTDPVGWAARIAQMKMPAVLAMPATLAVGVAEIFAAVLLIVPRFRRWGAWLMSLLLVAFMIYIGYHYQALIGAECSCFPWIKRSIGPPFFAADFLMIVAAALAGWFAEPSRGLKSAALVLGAIVVFTGASYGITITQQSGAMAPESVTVNGAPYSLKDGRFFIYFFDPACMHCFEAAKQMSGYQWNQTRVLAVPTVTPQFAGQFLKDTGLQADLTNDLNPLKERFPFHDPPFGVAIEGGRQRDSVIHFDSSEPRKTLRGLGWID
jgi:uncharacterized membrane protein YphA (DoxX/SURF4 family)